VLADATPGDGVVWLTYLTNDNYYHFKLIDNEGNEIWTVHTDMQYLSNIRSAYVQKVIFEEDGLVTVFFNNGRFRYNLSGEEVLREEEFFQLPYTIVDVRNIIVGAQGGYVLIGAVSIAGMRALAVGFDREGNELFTRIFSVTANGRHAYTGAQVLEDGTCLLAGSYTSPVAALMNAFFVTRIAPDGAELFTQVHSTTEFHGAPANTWYPGRDLIKTGHDNYLFAIDGWGSKPFQRLVQFDAMGNETADQQVIEFRSETRSYGLPPFIGSVIAGRPDGSIVGVLNSNQWFLPGAQGIATAPYMPPHYANLYQFSLSDHTLNAADFNRLYSNYLSAAVRLSNGNVMIAGTILSLGADMKIIIAIL